MLRITIQAQCWLCQQPLHLARHGICSVCVKYLPVPPPCCPRCGLPSSHVKLDCGRCLRKPPPWDALVQVSDYIAPLSGLVMRLKFAKQPELALPLARLLLFRWLARFRAAEVVRPDILLSVPLHRRRYFSRGYNQSELLAAPLARWLQCQFHPYALQRIRATPPQQRLSESARKRNLRRAFICRENFHGKHVALLDDVVTTGSTLCEISKLLRNQGIASLQIWCVCRTL